MRSAGCRRRRWGTQVENPPPPEPSAWPRQSVRCRASGQAAAEAAALGPDHMGFSCDVSRDSDVKAAIGRVLTRYGGLDVIHNNAGIANPAKPVHETTDEEWNSLLDINVKSILHTTRHGIAALRESKGCILNTSSLVGVIGQEIHAAYTATKGAMNTLTKSMAIDYARHGIRVNAVCPAGSWTPMLQKWADEQPDPAGVARYLDEIHLLGYCPGGDVISATEVPDSACRSANAICSSEKCFFPIRKTHPFW
ncbi:MAG: SDR family NAD(P)-dependent oxidoreductase [Planctomycetia bacterium]